ncbi:serine hydrolase [Nordella sp. HKS 07]|uniref:serine hydrolase domain-containing protein n=1 Tax=Nordella sp. HKS 07 TaxID=2712222 RepID=UPI0013E20727|nr:serine hydrolase [Nordella sp. HKS 07]QIG47552.1 serine hydrolase [Nordella sp. HKS 07]
MTSYKNSEPRPPIMRESPPKLRVPFADWDRPPWNRWSFQHVRELLPTAEVWRGNGPPSSLPQVPHDLSGIEFSGADGVGRTVESFLDESYTDGFLVLHKGRILTERYFNGMGERSLHLSQSMAKSVTAAAAGCLVAQGLLDPDALITYYLPELEGTAYRGARLRHVLDMTSGVRFSEDYTDPHSDIGRSDVASGWKPAPAGADGFPEHMWELILSLTALERPHGELFVYRSIETDVLAFCMERASGKRLPQLVSELLWQPMGADESACFTLDRAGYALADGGLNATLRDYARFGALYLQDGYFNGRQIVPAGWVLETRIGDARLFGEPYTLTTPNGAYRNQFWIEDVSRPAIMCRGVFGQLIYIDPARDLVVVKLSSWPDFLNIELGVNTLRMIHALANELV